MITNRYFNWIAAILMGVTVVVMGVVIFFTQTKGFHASATHFDYESTVFGSGQVATVAIEVDQSEWENLLQNATDKEYIPAKVAINGKTLSEVGIRAKGNTSLTQVAGDDTTDRYSFKLEFDHYISDQTFDGLDKLALNNVISDPTYMKEYLSYQMLETLDIAVPRYGFADVTVNGEAWGFYFTVEVLEESYLERNYGSDYGKLYKPETDEGGGGAIMPGGQRPEGMPDMPQQGMEPMQGNDGQMPEDRSPAQDGAVQQTSPAANSQGEPTQEGELDGQTPFAGGERPQGEDFPGGLGNRTSAGSSLVYTDSDADSYSDIFDNAVTKVSDADKQRVIEALKHLESGEDLERYFDVDEILRYFAANTAMVNLDSYVGMFTHNYYLYEKDGKLSILPWDYNLSFGGFQGESASSAVNFPIDTPTASGISLEDRPLIGKLLENEEYRNKYHEYLQEIVTNYFENGLFELTITKLDGMIAPYVQKDASAFYTYEEYQAAVNELKEFGALRAASIKGQLNGTIPSTREAQQENPSALLDASSIDLSVLGSMMGGGQMGKNDGKTFGPGQMGQGERGRPGNTAASPPDAQQQNPGQTVSFGTPADGDPDSAGQDNPVEQAGRFGEGRQPLDGFFHGSSQSRGQNGISPQAWWTVGICLAAMLAGLAFVIAYRRRST